MKGLLIYDSIGAQRNNWFIDQLTQKARKNGIQLQLIINDETSNIKHAADFAIVRTISPNTTKYLEEKGIRVFNNYKTSFYANDKWQTFVLCKRLKIPTMETWLGNTTLSQPPYPFILKGCNGHGGKEVFWINSTNDYSSALNFFNSAKMNYIIQRPCSVLGKDMRLYVLGGNIIATVLRHNPQNFKSNYSLGGTAVPSTPNQDQIEIVNKLVSTLKSSFIGVDFIQHKGTWVLNEIEDVVGSRMLYNTTTIDIAEKYIHYIIHQMKSQNRGFITTP